MSAGVYSGRNQMSIDPKQDGPGQRQQLADAIRHAIDHAGTYRNCITCSWFNVDETCAQEKHKGLRPPATIIAYGCDDHSDLIPF